MGDIHWHERDDFNGIITFVLLLLLVIYSAWLMAWIDGVLSDNVKLDEPDFTTTVGLSRTGAESIKTAALILLIITLTFSSIFIWELISDMYKLHEIIANSKAAIITTGILLGIIIWMQSSLGKVPKDIGGASDSLKSFNTSLLVIITIALAIFTIPMLLATKQTGGSLLQDADDMIFGAAPTRSARRPSRRLGRAAATGGGGPEIVEGIPLGEL
ncbi:hypothetical protein OAK19_04550 [Aureispira]|nr:hypothetical protein [Aureispira sp.]